MTAKKTASKKTPAKRATTKSKSAVKPKAEAKPAKTPKADAKPKEDLVVFALRMTKAEREALHRTAGPRGATRLARSVLVATANEDEAAFKEALAEARKLRG